jgi:hypothetical protein
MPDRGTTSVPPSVLDEVFRIKPREVSGSRSSNRFDFQKSWALCLLLKLHRTGQDYLVLFDYHDDVVVLDSAANPTAIDFYQVKTKKGGNWTATLLLKREKGANDELLNSIVGKMYSNKIAFPKAARTLNFVSNAQFAVKHKNDPNRTVTLDGFELAELCKETLKEFSQSIQKEHNLIYSPLCDIVTRFTADPLSLESHATHAAGEFVNFLDQIRPNGKFAAVPGHRAIATAIARKTSHERSPSTKEELISSKGITRADFEQMLATVLSHEEERERWDAVNQALIAEGHPFGDVNRWRNAFKKYAVERIDSSNTVLMAVQRTIKSSVAAAKRENQSLTVRELISGALQRFDSITRSAATPFSRDYLTAVILFEASEE